MVATFNNYQELVDRALMIEGKEQQIDNHKRKYGQGRYTSGAQQKPRYSRTREDITTTMEVITMEDIRIMEQVRITTMAPRMAMGMEEAAARTIPTLQHQPRGICATLPISSAIRPDIMSLDVLKQRMEMAMKVLPRSPTPSPKDR